MRKVSLLLTLVISLFIFFFGMFLVLAQTENKAREKSVPSVFVNFIIIVSVFERQYNSL